MRWLRRVLDGLPPGSRLLDLGCGSGVPATREIARTHSVLGVDVSHRQIESARRNVPNGEFRQADVLDLELAEGSFDAVVAFYLLDHIPRQRLSELVSRMARWLKPSGLLLICSEPEDRPGAVYEWLGVPMYFSSIDAPTTTRLIQDAGFSIVTSAIESQLEGNREVEYLWLLARKQRAPAVPALSAAPASRPLVSE
jgi:cyclopropane fatty-acyl-phospholipid synthase-like methyltransferase